MLTAVLWIASLALLATLAAAAVAARLAAQLREARERLLAEAEGRTQAKGLLAASEDARAELTRARDLVDELRAEVERAKDELRAEVARAKDEALVLQREIDRLGAGAVAARAAEEAAALRQREAEAKIEALGRAAEQAAAELRGKEERLARAETEAKAGADRGARIEKDVAEAYRRLGAAQAEGAQLAEALRKAEADAVAARTAGDAFATEARALRDEMRGLKAKLAQAEARASEGAASLPPPPPTPAAPAGAVPSMAPPVASRTPGRGHAAARSAAAPQKVATWSCQRCGKQGIGPQVQPCCPGWKATAGHP